MKNFFLIFLSLVAFQYPYATIHSQEIGGGGVGGTSPPKTSFFYGFTPIYSQEVGGGGVGGTSLTLENGLTYNYNPIFYEGMASSWNSHLSDYKDAQGKTVAKFYLWNREFQKAFHINDFHTYDYDLPIIGIEPLNNESVRFIPFFSYTQIGREGVTSAGVLKTKTNGHRNQFFENMAATMYFHSFEDYEDGNTSTAEFYRNREDIHWLWAISPYKTHIDRIKLLNDDVISREIMVDNVIKVKVEVPSSEWVFLPFHEIKSLAFDNGEFLNVNELLNDYPDLQMHYQNGPSLGK